MVLRKRRVYIRGKEINYYKMKDLDGVIRHVIEVVSYKGRIEQSYYFKGFERALLCFHNMMINVKYA